MTLILPAGEFTKYTYIHKTLVGDGEEKTISIHGVNWQLIVHYIFDGGSDVGVSGKYQVHEKGTGQFTKQLLDNWLKPEGSKDILGEIQ